MVKSLEQLLDAAIDYSGMFPPNELDLREALREYVGFANSDKAQLLSRFVIPFEKIPELAKFADKKHMLKGPLNLCIAGPDIQTLTQFKNVILTMEQQILDAHSGYPGELRTNILELKFPSKSVINLNAEELVKALEAVVLRTAESRLLPHRVFFEIPEQALNIDTTKKIIRVIAAHNKSVLKRKVDNYLFSGLKINCGFADTGMEISDEYLAEAILFARDANVAVKFSGDINTAYPVFDKQTGKKIHGFINILAASMLAYTQDLNLEETVEVLEDRNPDNFVFKDGFFMWRELAAPVMEIKMLRMLSITSFNSTDPKLAVKELREGGLI